MDSAELAIRILLAVVFATAAVGKLLDLAGSRQAMSDFGVPERFTRAAAVLLPVAELLAAVLLVFPGTARWGAVLALLLLLAFIAGIANALRKGMAPDCHCFGQIHSAPAGAETLIRNGILAALALFAAIEAPGPSVTSWIDQRSTAEIAAVLLGVGAGLLAVFSLQLWTEVKRLRRELVTALNEANRARALAPPGLPVGTIAPEFAASDLDNTPVTLADLQKHGHPVLLVFVSPGCGSCHEVLPSLRRWQQTLSERLTIAIVSSGGADPNRTLASQYGLEGLLVQEAIEVSERYRIRGTPSAVLVNAEGKIASPAAESVFEIEPMVRHVLRGGDMMEPAPSDGSVPQGAVA